MASPSSPPRTWTEIYTKILESSEPTRRVDKMTRFAKMTAQSDSITALSAFAGNKHLAALVPSGPNQLKLLHSIRVVDEFGELDKLSVVAVFGNSAAAPIVKVCLLYTSDAADE